jgi:hypothetical protein
MGHPVTKTPETYLSVSRSDDGKLTAGAIATCCASGRLLLTLDTSVRFTSRNSSATKAQNYLATIITTPLPPRQTVAPWRPTELGALPGTNSPMA